MGHGSKVTDTTRCPPCIKPDTSKKLSPKNKVYGLNGDEGLLRTEEYSDDSIPI